MVQDRAILTMADL